MGYELGENKTEDHYDLEEYRLDLELQKENHLKCR